MSIRTTLKTYFEKYDKPKEVEFAEWIDATYMIEEGLGVKDTATTTKTIVIPADQMLAEVVIWSAVAAVISVGDSLGSGEYLQNETLTPGEPLVLSLNVFAPGALKNIFVTTDNSISLKYYVK